MKNYDEVKAGIFATCNYADGYFGDTREVGIALSGNITVLVTDDGYFRAPIPPVVDEEDALWLLRNHPSAKDVKSIREVGS